MTAFPPEWQVHNDVDFESFHLSTAESGHGMGMTLLSRVDRDGHLTGTFRCCISGSGPTTILVPATRFFPDPPDFILRLTFEVSVDSEELSPPNNSVATVWKDLSASVRDRTIIPTFEGQPADPAIVLDYLKALASRDTPAGTSSRWAIAATASTSPTTLQMEFQVLPAPAKSLTKNNLKAENCVSVQVARIPLNVELFDGVLAAGPVPTLFAASPGQAFDGLMENANVTLDDVHKLNARFLFMEHLTMESAVIYLQGPAKRAKGVAAYPPPFTADQQASKRQKIGPTQSRSADQGSETGVLNILLTIIFNRTHLVHKYGYNRSPHRA
jgi:hypothetical protein